MSLKDIVLSKKQKIDIFDRIESSILKAGYKSRREFVRALKESGVHITSNALSAYSIGKSAPSAETLIGIARLLKVDINWILTGKEPSKPSISQLKQIVGEMIETQGAQISEIDSVTLEVDKLLSRLKSVDAKQQILRMIKGYVELEERGE